MPDPVIAPADLANWLQYPVKEASAVLAEQVAVGWLKDAMGVLELPAAPKGTPLYSWALELSGIAYENPLSLAAGSLGDEASTYDRGRRDRILTSAASASAGRGVGGPLGCFPPPVEYPDPAYRDLRPRW
ncbi:hypothetical protein [Blastococcus sp. CT_GayMR16]|uniref:hypothetical protein n=1 Tax=Blastococcus sp. CT_GayMR16 TaxID=2559607 RepID=UPI0010740C0A|nr:hypothetical protein [Blastococcus sp. CT_GayMR16]TFV83155.1 hypothetical protein E4P38_21095 [Blastococcus sp. CT_GayMR16]